MSCLTSFASFWISLTIFFSSRSISAHTQAARRSAHSVNSTRVDSDDKEALTCDAPLNRPDLLPDVPLPLVQLARSARRRQDSISAHSFMPRSPMPRQHLWVPGGIPDLLTFFASSTGSGFLANRNCIVPAVVSPLGCLLGSKNQQCRAAGPAGSWRHTQRGGTGGFQGSISANSHNETRE